MFYVLLALVCLAAGFYAGYKYGAKAAADLATIKNIKL